MKLKLKYINKEFNEFNLRILIGGYLAEVIQFLEVNEDIFT